MAGERTEGDRGLNEVRHDDPDAKLPPRKDGKPTVDRMDLWSALVIRAGEQLKANEREDSRESC